ncbi:MAG: substrate-binding domain-containing protein [Lachnospiraceae bacterium]|nr:substrate-binding domain-containing protein [Lachnospiraceae bacterium]
MKKALVLVLALVLALGLLAGCGGKKETEAPQTEAPATEAPATEAPETDAPETDAPETEAPEAKNYTYPQVGEAANPAMVEQEPAEPLKFAFIGFANNSYWDLIYQGVDAAVANLGEHNVQVDKINLGSDITAEAINNALETCASQGYDGIVVTVFVPGCENYINDLVAGGCQVAIIGGDAPGECDRFCYIGQGDVPAATVIAQSIDEALGGEEGAEFAVITATFAMANLELKRNTVIEYLEGKGYKCVGSYEAHDSADETYDLTNQLITANPNLKAIYMVAGGTYGAPRAAEENNVADKIYLIGHDETAENLEYVRKGELTVVGQNPTGYAYDAFIYLYNKVVAGQDPEEEVMASLALLINKDNVDELFPAE